tara:strand:- start:30 stop:236 length:207 start_codon:yes stop_codon:yes gene_type:complete
MNININIDLENAAFEHAGEEVNRILVELGKRLSHFENLADYSYLGMENITDINGNTVGNAIISKEGGV